MGTPFIIFLPQLALKCTADLIHLDGQGAAEMLHTEKRTDFISLCYSDFNVKKIISIIFISSFMHANGLYFNKYDYFFNLDSVEVEKQQSAVAEPARYPAGSSRSRSNLQ